MSGFDDAELFRFSSCLYVLHDDFKKLEEENKQLREALKTLKERKGALYIRELLKEAEKLGKVTEFERSSIRGYYISNNAPSNGKFIKVKEI